MTIPLTAMKYLYRNEPRKKIVCEIDIEALGEVNGPDTIDEMIAEARLEYASGKTRGYTDMHTLVADLHA